MLSIGGRPVVLDKESVKQGAQVLIGTPGRILDLLEREVINQGFLRMLVLDEADEMLG